MALKWPHLVFNRAVNRTSTLCFVRRCEYNSLNFKEYEIATPRKTPSGNYELTITNKLLPKRVFLTFETEATALAYANEAERLLRAGVVPPGLLAAATPKPALAADTKLTVLIQQWRNAGRLSRTDDAILGWLLNDAHVANCSLSGLSYVWAEAWLHDLKINRTLAPSSIRQRVQALSKVIDWFIRSNPDTKSMNPLRLLPRGYSVYSDQDARVLRAAGGDARRDVVRDRRLRPGEYEGIVEALSGQPRGDKQRPLALPDGNAMAVLFELIIRTGCRLREAYTLRKENVNFMARMIRVQTTKQRNGNVVFRDVPIRPELYRVLRDYMTPGPGLLFPFWDGTEPGLVKATSKLSARFATLFEYVPCDSLVEHDLRHEATCQWFELRDDSGQWLFRAEEVNKIMGWAPGSAMAGRYASFRAEALSQRLWAGRQAE